VWAVQNWSNGRCGLFKIGIMEGVGCSNWSNRRCRLIRIGVMVGVGCSKLE
jgi:hypothetical protein